MGVGRELLENFKSDLETNQIISYSNGQMPNETVLKKEYPYEDFEVIFNQGAYQI